MKANNLVVGVALLFSMNVISQQQPQHQKKIYMSPEGKLYFNKSLPVYFWVSDSPDPKAPKYKLSSETTPQYSNPMYFDTEGRNTLRSPSAVDTVTKNVVYPKMDIQFQVYADSKPPETSILFSQSNLNIFKKVYYIPDSLEIDFKSNDDLSGVDKIMVSIDSAPYQPFSSKLVLDKEKYYKIKYYAYDNTGNVESPHEIMFSVDHTAPSSSIKIIGDKYNDILSGRSIIDIVSVDTIAGVKRTYYCIDDSIYKPYYTKLYTANLTQGEHVINYYALDMVNNKEKPQKFEFYVDNTPPQVIEEVLGKTYIANGKEYSAGSSRLKISSFDNKAGVKDIYYSINGAAFEKYEKPIVLSGYKGNVSIRSYGLDNVGNKSETDLNGSRRNTLSYVDLTAPTISHEFSGPAFAARDTVFISQKTAIVLNSKDDESGIQKMEYQLDSNDLKNYDKPFYINNEGVHRISIFCYDNTDNMARQDFSVVVDTTGPEIFNRFSTVELGTEKSENNFIPVYPSYVVVFLSATDLKSGYENLMYKLNKFQIQPYLHEIKDFPIGHNIIKVKAIDKLGNATEKIIEFDIK